MGLQRAGVERLRLASLSALRDYSGSELERVLDAQVRLIHLAQHN
jgi:hypothetical protein